MDLISFESVRRWKKKFVTGTESVKDAAKWPTLHCNRQANGLKAWEIIKSNGRYTIRDNVKAVGILQSRVHFIVKSIL